MERLLQSIAHKCAQEGIIETEQTEWLLYSLRRRLMNMGGFLVLICFGAVVASFPQVLFLNLGLAFLREKTNGLHMPTVISCFAFSLICEYICLYAINHLDDISVVSLFVLGVSTVLIYWLAPCNNAALHFSEEELEAARKAVHERLILFLLLLLGFLVFIPTLVNTIIVAEAAVAVLVVLAKLGAGIR